MEANVRMALQNWQVTHFEMKEPRKSKLTLSAILMGIGLLLVIIGFLSWYPGRNYEELGGYVYFMVGIVYGLPGVILLISGMVLLVVYQSDKRLWRRIGQDSGEPKGEKDIR
jgi:uncharacterized membrane protein YidH (DUF202 family)